MNEEVVLLVIVVVPQSEREREREREREMYSELNGSVCVWCRQCCVVMCYKHLFNETKRGIVVKSES